MLSRNSLKSADEVKQRVRAIIQQVKLRGDVALKQYTQQFDGVDLPTIAVSEQEWLQAEQVTASAKKALTMAYNNIQRFHQLQIPKAISLDSEGVYLRREYRALDRVGLYIPGGSAPLISTLLMLAIPAGLAGCQEIIATTPPEKDGNINPLMLYAAKLCGINRLYKVGGAQAIAALAYGTATIDKVDKIFGPGNAYVTEAKMQVAEDPAGSALDMPAGPSEVLVIADSNANANIIAADLLAQAEHDAAARAILVTTDRTLAENVLVAVQQQLARLSRKNKIEQALADSTIIIVDTLLEGIQVSNAYAPEHLILQIDNPQNYLSMIRNAGSVFIGPWSAEALGDYASGSTHVLPTYGYAKSYSGLGVESFMKSITFQKVQAKGLLNLASCVETLAELEGLDAHKNSVVLRRLLIEEALCVG